MLKCWQTECDMLCFPGYSAETDRILPQGKLYGGICVNTIMQSAEERHPILIYAETHLISRSITALWLHGQKHLLHS